LKYPDPEDAISSNEAIIAQFGGSHSILNLGNLNYCMESVKDIPESLPNAIAAKAAHLIFCLVRNHPFLDGNKRTAFHIACVFAELNGFEISGVLPIEAVSVLATVAEGKADEGQLMVWVKKHLRRIA